MVHAVHEGLAVRTAVRVHGKRTAPARGTRCHERTAAPEFAEPVLLERERYGHREVIEDHRGVDVGRHDARTREQFTSEAQRTGVAFAVESRLGEEGGEVGLGQPARRGGGREVRSGGRECLRTAGGRGGDAETVGSEVGQQAVEDLADADEPFAEVAGAPAQRVVERTRFEKRAELVAPESCQRVAPPQPPGHDGGELAQQFVARWIWFKSGPHEEVSIEAQRFAAMGCAIDDANVRSAALTRIRNGASPALYSELEPADAWITEAIARCWPNAG